jgi:hypothetical protein
VLSTTGKGEAGAVGGCQAAYDYAGAQDFAPHAGLRATLRNMVAPLVRAGHVAGWLGVGGPGRGPNGTTEWLQIGYASMQGMPQQIYYEVTLPDKPSTYHAVEQSVGVGEQHRVTVLEVARQPGSWRVWLDGKPASPAIRLPGSHRRFEPQALAETWNAGSGQCNRYGYSFRNIQAARAPGGPWGRTKAGYVWRDQTDQVFKTSPDSFLARSAQAHATSPPLNEPPLLGAIASHLAGRLLAARCQPQHVPVIEQPSGTLRLSTAVCAILDGYALANPWVPQADQPAGLTIAETALAFLRGVARAAGTQPSRIDCRALTYLHPAFRTLGATTAQALAFRHVLLRQAHLNLPPGCHIH